jgi:two-component system, NarL family, sensor histidine kinase LiaS
MNPGKYAVMDGTIFLRTFGQKSSSFFDRRLSLGSLKLVIAILSGLVLLSIVVLTAHAVNLLLPIDDTFTLIERISSATHDLTTGHWPISRYLLTGEDYAEAEVRAQHIQATVQQLLPLVDDYAASDRLEATSATYLNLLRSYHSVASGDGSNETLRLLREQLISTADSLDELANNVRERSIDAGHEKVLPLSQHIIWLAAVILVVLSIFFAASMGIVTMITRHSARMLGDIRQVAQHITEGRFDARINLLGEHDHDIVQLGQAFNHMADNLNLAQQSEAAATEQNRLQLLKLARQERMTAILEERQRIARELHDSVKQQLFSITLSASVVLNLMPDAPAQAKTHLEHIKQAGHSAQSEMTILLQELVSEPLQDKRLEDALLDYLNPLCQMHALKLIWRTDGTNTLTISQEHTLFRAVQEAVSNVVRHSEATVLRVSIRYGLITQVIVEDNGKGFVVEKISPTSNGLALMRTRLKRVGGRCDVQTAPGTGTRLTIHLDLRRR